MNRLEKKCFMASAGIHGGLLLLLFVAPLIWVSKRQEVSLPMLTFIPSQLIDGAMAAGGNPAVERPPTGSPPVQQQAVAPPAPPVEVTRPDPEPETKPHPDQRAKPTKTEPAPVERKPVKVATAEPAESRKPTRHKIQLSFERDPGASKRKAEAAARARAENARNAQRKFTERLNSVVGAIGQGVSSSTSIDIPGPGGAAYADYSQWVMKVYHDAWTMPNNLSNDSLSATATVVIRRDGSVESFKVTDRSGHTAFDASVKRLENVSFVARFPDGALDDKRQFVIKFQPRSKS